MDIYARPDIRFDWELSGGVSFKFHSKQTSGFEYNTETGRTDIVKKEQTITIMAQGSFEGKIGPCADIGIELLNTVLSGGFTAEIGAKVTAEVEAEEDIVSSADSKHACDLCVSGKADWYASVSVKCSYKITDNILKGDIVNAQILAVTEPIMFNIFPGQFFISLGNSVDSPYGGSPHFGGGECINKVYRTEFKVQDESGNEKRALRSLCSGREKRKMKVNLVFRLAWDIYTVVPIKYLLR